MPLAELVPMLFRLANHRCRSRHQPVCPWVWASRLRSRSAQREWFRAHFPSRARVAVVPVQGRARAPDPVVEERRPERALGRRLAPGRVLERQRRQAPAPRRVRARFLSQGSLRALARLPLWLLCPCPERGLPPCPGPGWLHLEQPGLSRLPRLRLRLRCRGAQTSSVFPESACCRP